MSDARVEIRRTASGGTVILPMDPSFLPMPWWTIGVTDPVGVVLVMLWVIGNSLYRSMSGLHTLPRASFEIDEKTIRMQIVDHETGGLRTREIARDAILELRKNQYDHGLWIHVRGVSMDTYLQDIDDKTIEALVQAAWSILKPQDSTLLVVRAATVA